MSRHSVFTWTDKDAVPDSDLFLVTAAVDLFLQRLHALEGLFAVDAVDEHEAVGEAEVMAWELDAITQTPCVIETHLLPCASVRLHRADIDVLQRLHGLRTYRKNMRSCFSETDQTKQKNPTYSF